MTIDLLIGSWGDGTGPDDRVLASIMFRPSVSGGAFMVIDAKERLASKRELCGRALQRVEVVGTPLAAEIFSLLDGIWLTDPRINEVIGTNRDT